MDFRAKILEVGPAQQAAICGRSNLSLIESGAVQWSDVVTSGRIRSLREVAARNKLSVDAMVKAGVAPRLAREAYEAVHTGQQTASEARRKDLAQAMLGKGYTRQQILDSAGRAIGSRVAIGAGPSGPSVIDMGQRTPKPPPVPIVRRAALVGSKPAKPTIKPVVARRAIGRLVFESAKDIGRFLLGLVKSLSERFGHTYREPDDGDQR